MANENTTFPPPIAIRCRVWSYGYSDHGPMEGPRVNIPAGIGGTITEIGLPFWGGSEPLYSVSWDNGQQSKHYGNGLNCIDNFQTIDQYHDAVRVIGLVELTIGPLGGFRKVVIELEYKGNRQSAEIYDRDLWLEFLSPQSEKNGVSVKTIQLPPAERKKKQLSPANSSKKNRKE